MLRVLLLTLVLGSLSYAQEGGAVEGTVVNPNTGQGIAGVTVVLYTRQAVRYETTTDTTGAFRVTDMSPGDYEVRFEKENYTIGRKEPAQPYHVAPGQKAIRIRLEMTRQSEVRGRVVDSGGNQVANAQVKLGDGLTVVVSEGGEFTFKGIEPGLYTLLAIPKPVAAKGEERVEAVPTFFPSSLEPGDAQHIVVSGDTDLADLEIRLQSAPVHRVRGVVLDETGARVAGARVSLLPVAAQKTRVVSSMNGTYLTLLGPGPGVGLEEAQTVSDSNGGFEFSSVPSGSWQIAATSSVPSDSVDFDGSVRSGAFTVPIEHADVNDLQILTGAPFAMSGTVDWGDLSKRAADVFLTPGDGRTGLVALPVQLPLLPLSPAEPEQAPNESFRVGVVPGRYYVVPRFFAGFYPASVLLGGREVLGQQVYLASGSPPIQVIYKPALGSIQGKVDNVASTLIIIPDQVVSVGFGRAERPKADGTFEITGLPPGSYVLVALTGLDQRARFHQAVLAKVATSGIHVNVDQAAAWSVTLTAVPWLQ